MNDCDRRDMLRNLEDLNNRMAARVKAAGTVVRPTHLDKLPNPRSSFCRGRKATI